MDTRYTMIGGERCQNCGRIYKICWKAPDDIWEKITGGKPGESLGGLLCPTCFDTLYAANGISLFWECKLEDSKINEENADCPHTKIIYVSGGAMCKDCGVCVFVYGRK